MIKNFILKYLKWFILLICIVGFLNLTEDVFSNEFMQIDVTSHQLISNHLISEPVTKIAKIITNFGGSFFLIFIVIILAITLKNKKIVAFVFLNLILSFLLNSTLKNILQRPRPTEYMLINEKGYSFPSGHSMVSMAFYGFLIYLIYKFIKNKTLKTILICFLTLLIFLIGISRIYLGVHYTTDVIAGFLVAISYLILYTSIIKKYIIDDEK